MAFDISPTDTRDVIPVTGEDGRNHLAVMTTGGSVYAVALCDKPVAHATAADDEPVCPACSKVLGKHFPDGAPERMTSAAIFLTVRPKAERPKSAKRPNENPALGEQEPNPEMDPTTGRPE